MIFHKNRLSADDSHEISCLIFLDIAKFGKTHLTHKRHNLHQTKISNFTAVFKNSK